LPEFAAPWVLLGLVLVPVIRWLHHYRRQGPPIEVSALFLWQGLRSDESGAVRSPRPEMPWWRRAGVAALLVLALAAPQLPVPEAETVQVWWDDAPSMGAVEQGRSRHAAAIEGLLGAAAASGVASLRLSALRGGPALELVAADRDAWAAAIAQWLDRLPPADGVAPLPVLDPQGIHWLVSDGAGVGLDTWAAWQPLSRVIAVGAATENIAITRLALRAAPGRDRAVAGLVLVHNAGRRPASVELTVSAGERVLHRERLEPMPATTVEVPFMLPAPPAGLEARVRRLDGVPEPLGADDSLSLAPASFAQPHAVSVSGVCPAAVDWALAAHPGLTAAPVSEQGGARLQIACTERPPVGGPPLLWLPTPPGATRLVSGDAFWLDAPPGGDARLPLGTARRITAPPGPELGDPLLTVDGDPLAVLRPGPRPAVTLLLDLREGPFARSAAFARIFAALTDRLMEEDLLAPLAAVSRPEAVTRIAPSALEVTGTPPPVPVGRVSLGLTPWLLWLATLLLTWDLSVVWRRSSAMPVRGAR